jgi:hypothetical protein
MLVYQLSAIVIYMKISKKLVTIVVIVLVTGAAITSFAVLRSQNSDTDEFGNGDKVGKTYLRSGFGDGNYLYSCSKEIEVKYQGSSLGPGAVYTPVNQEEFKKYCRSNAAIEYRAVIDILKRDDVSSVIAKYDTTQASVRALGHKYIHDKDYLKRILPTYSDIKIDCIIVVHSPEGTRFFIEDGEKHESHHDHHYLEVPDTEFLASLNNASDADITAFWLALH